LNSKEKICELESEITSLKSRIEELSGNVSEEKNKKKSA
jgi:peptidoglycan hydrolase CwlO-like protein